MPRQADATVMIVEAPGSVGSRVVESLAAGGRHDLRAIDVARPPTPAALAVLPGVDFRGMDVRDREPLAEASHRCTQW